MKNPVEQSIYHLNPNMLKSICCGCGICVAVCPVQCLELTEGNDGYIPERIKDKACINCNKCSQACPGLVQEEHYKHDAREVLCYGHSLNETLRWQAASGGITTELLGYLLDKGHVDYIVTSQRYAGKKPMPVFVYNKEELNLLTGSNYCPVPIGLALSEIKNNNGSCAIVCLPCEARGIRTIVETFPEFKGKIKYIISLLCNHVPSFKATEFLNNKYGRPNCAVSEIQYRGQGWFGAATISYEDNDKLKVDFNEYFSSDFFSLFHRPRCLMCLDHFGLAADISVGDADFVKFKDKDNVGETSCFVRNVELLNIIKKMEADGICLFNFNKTENEFLSCYEAINNCNNERTLQARRLLRFPTPIYNKENPTPLLKLTFRQALKLNYDFYYKMIGNYNILYKIYINSFKIKNKCLDLIYRLRKFVGTK
jgi:coenzyme F420 hydrogenase subunit beta